MAECIGGLDPVLDDFQALIRARLETFTAANALGPVQRQQIVFYAEHGGCVDCGPFKQALIELAALGHAEKFRQGPVRCEAFKAFDGIGAEDQHAMGRFTAQHLLPGIGDHIELLEGDVLREHGGGGITDHNAVRVGLDPVGIGDAHAGCRAVPGEDDVGIIAGF